MDRAASIFASRQPPERPPLPTSLRRWLLFGLAVHLALGAALGLSVDEAHYALYAAHPALSYFDHPPLVGWVQWPLVALGAPDALLRLLPGLLWVLCVVLVYDITCRLQNAAGASLQEARKAGAWAVALVGLAPLLHILAIGLVPDTLLMVLHLAVMAQTLRMMASDRPGLGAWLLLGCLLGLAGLSKYTAIFTAVAVLVCLVPALGLRVLATPGPWLALGAALLLASPVAIWNAQHDWISFVYQAQHGAGGPWSGLHLMRFVLVQLLAYGPLLLVGFWGLRQITMRWRWLLAFFAVPFGVLAFLSGGGSSLPHWTAPAWVALVPWAAIALAGARAGSRQSRSVGGPLLVKVLVVFQAMCSLALPGLMLSGGMPFLAGRSASAESSDPPNPFADLHGWDRAGARAAQLAHEHGLGSVAVQNWTLASRMGWYARPLPVYVLENRFDQFDLWAGDLPVGGRTLLVDWSQMPYALPLGDHGFASCTLLAREPIQHWGYALAEFRFFDCQGWSGQPAPRLQTGASLAAPSGSDNHATP